METAVACLLLLLLSLSQADAVELTFDVAHGTVECFHEISHSDGAVLEMTYRVPCFSYCDSLLS